MPEDQGQNGDRWTAEASRLLERLGWEKVADSNIDIEGVDGLKHGIDALFRFPSAFAPSKIEGVFLEAKRYGTPSFSPTKLQDWVDKLDEKMLELRRSEEFNTRYPKMAETDPRNGLLAIWFHDTANYPQMAHKLETYLSGIRLPRRYRARHNRLFVLHNDGILRLASLADAAKDLAVSLSLPDGLAFHYPSLPKYGNLAADRRSVSLEYMFSKLVLARAQVPNTLSQAAHLVDVVFFFGPHDLASLTRLKYTLSSVGMLDAANDLYVYLYRRDLDRFRKIEPDAADLFGERVRFRGMNEYVTLPPWIQDGGDS